MSSSLTWAPLLLADPSPCLRWRVLRELLDRPEDDSEVQTLASLRASDPLVAPLLAAQASDGAWTRGDLAWRGNKVRKTTLALLRLGYLGFDGATPAVARGADYLFSLQRDDGAWAIPGADDAEADESADEIDAPEGYTMIPLQTALPLRALAACGYATDPRAERAYAWLLEQRLPDGAWPTGVAGGGTYGRVAGYRKLPHSRWGCRSNTTGALLCLAHHPTLCHAPEAQRALDLLLGRETRDAHALGFEVGRLIGATPTRGFMTFYAKFDLALVLDLCWRVGAILDDARVAGLVDFVREAQGPYGLWDHPTRPQASRWLTFDLLRSLSRLDTAGTWVSTEPRTPFQMYPQGERRH